jgi:hypothetical protein
VSKIPPLVASKEKMLAEENFVKEVPADTISSLGSHLKSLSSVIAQELRDLQKRKEEAEVYASRSRVLVKLHPNIRKK